MTGSSREAQTAESKAWDFQNSSQFLSSRADLLEQSEQKAWEFLHAFDPAIPVPSVVYNREFAVRELEKSIASLLQLAELPAGENFKRSVNRAGVELLAGIVPMQEQEKLALLEECGGKALL